MTEEAKELMPVEKAKKYGIDKLDNAELLAIILRVGQPGFPIMQMTEELMRSNGGKLKMLERRTREELRQIPGIGEVKAFQIEAVLEIMRRYNKESLGDRVIIKKAADIYNYMKSLSSRFDTEHIWILLLNRRFAVLECMEVSSGGTTATVFDLKTILRRILLTPGLESLVMVHNHPSGNLQPSPQDDNITRQMREGCSYLGFRMLDHVIVTQDGYYSYADNGRLE